MDEIVKRGPGRPPLREHEHRAEMHPEDPRELARIRAAKILENLGDLDEATDEFHFDLSLKPEGWSWEWKRYTVLNEIQHSHINGLRRTGWEFVDARKYPSLVPIGWAESLVLRRGMVLMERPKEITLMMEARDKRLAKNQMDIKAAQIEGIDPNFTKSNRGDPIGAHGVVGAKKSYSPMAVPD